VGAVIVKDGEIIGRGWHEFRGGPHAEVNAIRDANANGYSDLSGTSLYVNLEPCCHFGRTPPCTESIIANKIGSVFCGMTDPNPQVSGGGIAALEAASISVRSGILEAESRILNRAFIKYITTATPHVLLKSAISLDGKIATTGAASRWITGEESRADVHRLRRETTAVLCGIGTVLADDPELTSRIISPDDPASAKQTPQPVRVIVDTELRIPLESRLVHTAESSPVIVAASAEWLSRCARIVTGKREALEKAGVTILAVREKNGKVCLATLMKELGKREIDSVLLEAGSTIAAGALEAGIVDTVRFYIAPMVIGGERAPGAVGGAGCTALATAWKLANITVSRSGADTIIEGDVCSRV
jgi:diaminohydroxyphosphoribosylaminopyrimidine deaminase / 5-amino-6-(5-phosphoribosylamino)uracil reductase